MSAPHLFKMTLSLNVLEHLGINLYSNIPSVLSEAVANAWDADAEHVSIALEKNVERIIIVDDGIGMTTQEVNERYLTVGYRRRDGQPGTTKKGRNPMGRKGIGKLSLFSIADIVEVHTIKNGQKSALLMRLEDIRSKIKSGESTYFPEALDTKLVDFTKGTRIVLSSLRKKQTIQTVDALRKRLARRFSIIGPQKSFEVVVGNKPITPTDRDYYSKIQYLWLYGSQKQIVKLCTKCARKPEDRSKAVSKANINLSGWLGTVTESRDLKDEVGDNLNRIAIYVRGKLAQEDILGDFSERGVYASYLIGELHVDDFDQDTKDDSATTSRQHLLEDDPRYSQLRELVAKELKHIQNRWSEWRAEEGAKKALEIPAIGKWMHGLPAPYKRKAKAWLGKINRIRTDTPDERKQLLKHSILAFEFFRANENLEHLDSIDDENLQTVLGLFREVDGLETSLYGQIVRSRVSVIRALQEKVDKNARERVIQEYIYDHLWLLDPAWERAEATQFMEKRVNALFRKVNAALSRQEKLARLDIGYRETAGKHVIVELKRPNATIDLYTLAKQIQKYRNGLIKILKAQGRENEPVEFVCILGKQPSQFREGDGPKLVDDTLKPLSARIVLYENLLARAFKAYGDYLVKGQTVDRLRDVIHAIEEYSSEDES